MQESDGYPNPSSENYGRKIRMRKKKKILKKPIKPILSFDLNRGVWIADVGVMTEAISRGLTLKGVNSGRRWLRACYDASVDDSK